MGPFGNVIGAVWFFMLFLAAITSSLSMVQPAVALLMETLGLDRKKAVTWVVGLCLIGSGMTLWFTQGGTFWNTLDFWVGTVLIFVMAFIQIVAFSWVFGIDRGWKEIHHGALIQLPPVVKFILKYVAPLYLLVVFVGFCVQNLGASLDAVAASRGAQYAIGLSVATALFLLWAVRQGERRWRAAGMDLDDRQPLPVDERLF
jgi:SNF family Na+-dependent transporter